MKTLGTSEYTQNDLLIENINPESLIIEGSIEIILVSWQ